MAKSPTKTRKPRAAKPTTIDALASSTVIPGEMQIGRWSRSTDISVEEQARRFTQWPQIYGQRNASDCSTQTLRLYTTGKTGATMEKIGLPVRKVAGRKRMAYLTDTRRVGKSAVYADKAGDVTEILEHPALDTLHTPNPWQDHTEFMASLFLSGEFAGNLYLVPVKPDGWQQGDAIYLQTLMPQYVRVIPDPVTMIGGYTFGRNRADIETFGPNDLWHKKLKENVWNPYYGISPIQALLIEADIDAASATRDLAMWLNGARPDFMALLPPEVGSNQDVFDQFSQSLNRDHRGPQNAGQFKVSNAASIVPLQFTPREMENALRIANYEHRVAMAYDFPVTMSKLNDASRANGETGDVQRARFGIEPRIRSMAEFLTRYLLPMFDVQPGEAWFAYDNCVPQDDAGIAAVQVSLYGAGMVTLNEARAELGKDPMDDGDELKELPDPNPPETMNGPPGKGKDKSAVIERRGLATSGQAGGHDGKANPDLPGVPDEADGIFTRLEKAVRSWVNRTARRLNVDNIRTLIESPEVRGEFVDVVLPYIKRLFGIGLSAGIEQVPTAPIDLINDPYSVVPERGAAWLKNYTVKLSGEVTETMQDDVKQAISDGMVEGQTMAETTAKVATALEDGSGVRAERIARTETSRAVQNGELEAWKAMGIKYFHWLPSAGACPLCIELAKICNEANEGRGCEVGLPIAEIGDKIELPNGKSHTVKYANIDIANAHPGCRCKMIAVTDAIVSPVEATVGETNG